MRSVHVSKRGCGWPVDGGAYLTGEIGLLGTLPACVEIDPPIPLDMGAIPFTRGIYVVDFDLIFTEPDQRMWLTGTSAESLHRRDVETWDRERYGMSLHSRNRIGICREMSPEQVEHKLDSLSLRPGSYPSDYVLAINRAGRGRKVAREVAAMTEAVRGKKWRDLLAACWRLAGYSGKGSEEVEKNIRRLMVSVGATEDAAILK